MDDGRQYDRITGQYAPPEAITDPLDLAAIEECGCYRQARSARKASTRVRALTDEIAAISATMERATRAFADTSDQTRRSLGSMMRSGGAPGAWLVVGHERVLDFQSISYASVGPSESPTIEAAWGTAAIDPDKIRRAIERMQKPDAAMMNAVWENIPSPYDMDMDPDDQEAVLELLAAVLEAALQDR